MNARYRPHVSLIIVVGLAILLISAIPRAWCDPKGVQETVASLAPASSPDQVAERVRQDIAAGNLTSALDRLRPFARSPLQHPRLYSDFLVLLIWTGHGPQAIERFESLPVGFPKRAYLLRNMAKAYYDAQVYEKSCELYEETLHQTPEDNEALVGLIACLNVQGRNHEVPSVLDRFFPSNSFPAIGIDIARRLVAQKSFVQALDWYDLMIRTYPRSTDEIAKDRDDLFASLSGNQQTDGIEQLRKQAVSGAVSDLENYILCMVLLRRYTAAVDEMDAFAFQPEAADTHKAYWYAWAYYQTGRLDVAETIFADLNQRDPQHLPSQIGRCYCLMARNRFAEADARLKQHENAYPDHFELLFARAYYFEKQTRFWDAIRVYDHLLEAYPENGIAQRMRLKAFSDMGSPSLAKDLASKGLSRDASFMANLENDQAVDLLDWGEAPQAAAMLAPLHLSGLSPRYTFDYITALAEAGENEKVLVEFEAAQTRGDQIPDWLKLVAADTYLAMGQPDKALPLYDDILTRNPRSREALKGKLHAFQQMRHWKEADAVLVTLTELTPAKIRQGNRETINPQWLDLAILRGWYLCEQNRLREADALFTQLHWKAPANIEIRNALAHVHSWRGWPRRSLMEFEVIDSLNPGFLPSQPGKLSVMNSLGFKQAAREQLDTKLSQWPDSPHLPELRKAFDIEQMDTLRAELRFHREDDDALDYTAGLTYETPLNLTTRLYTYWLRQHTSQDELNTDDALIHRIGAGLAYHIDADWQVAGDLSTDIETVDTGLTGRVHYSPTDQWSFSLFGSSYHTDIAAKARAAGISASAAGIEATWRQSEWRQASAGYTRSLFSDDNDREQFFGRYEQHLWMKHDWLMHLGIDAYTSRNSLGDRTVYFNPEQDFSSSITHMTQQTLQKDKRHAFLHRLYLRMGRYHQEGYDDGWIGSIRYEQEHEIGYRHYILGGLGMGRSIYDGQGVQDITADIVYQWRF